MTDEVHRLGKRCCHVNTHATSRVPLRLLRRRTRRPWSRARVSRINRSVCVGHPGDSGRAAAHEAPQGVIPKPSGVAVNGQRTHALRGKVRREHTRLRVPVVKYDYVIGTLRRPGRDHHSSRSGHNSRHLLDEVSFGQHHGPPPPSARAEPGTPRSHRGPRPKSPCAASPACFQLQRERSRG